jgi:predicted PurR-regulated permease PerM
VIVDLVLVLVAAFWLMRDGAALRAALERWLPANLRDDLAFASDAIQVIVGGYVRAQLLVAVMVGGLAATGCFVIGVPYPLVVGALAGVFELIPIVGPFAGGAVALLLALTKDPLLVIPTLALFLVIHALEGYVVAPRVQGHFVQLHPLWAMMALFAGIEAGGFIGALLSIPAASLGAVFFKATVGDWKANRPDLFAPPAKDAGAERRRRRLLDQFRVFS